MVSCVIVSITNLGQSWNSKISVHIPRPSNTSKGPSSDTSLVVDILSARLGRVALAMDEGLSFI